MSPVNGKHKLLVNKYTCIISMMGNLFLVSIGRLSLIQTVQPFLARAANMATQAYWLHLTLK